MNESDFCCIKQVTKSISITIPIKYISNEIAAVSEILEGWKRQYVPKLQGVMVNYRNIRLSTRTVALHSSRTAPKCIITATFDLFCPTVGEIVKGTINRISREHIGCLIEGTINVSIHRQRNSPPELSKFIKINQPILFEIENFVYDRQTIRVKGHVSQECVELMKEVFPAVLVNGFVSKEDSAQSEDLFSNTESAAEEAFSNLDNYVELTNNTELKVDKTLNNVQSPKGKSRKRKQGSESPNLGQIKKKFKLSDPNLSGSSSDSSTVNDSLIVNEFIEKSNNKTLKRKRESETSPIAQHTKNKKSKPSDSASDSSEDSSDHEEKDSLSSPLSTKQESHNKKQTKQGTVDENIKKSSSNSFDSSSSEDSLDHEDEGVLNNDLLAIKQESPSKKQSNKKLKSKNESSKKVKKSKSSHKKESKKKKKSNNKEKTKSKKKSKVSATGEVLKKDKKKSKKDKKDKKKDKTKNSKSKSIKIKSELDKSI